eukprot:TRINITY_DN13951_c0_g1_i1.p1 TRINITY_DN13951_c0_g1~~TRINITY_DN13951_c0_g1_i1.p1  ORF type:complete len:733 (+),score=115.05 TRINITY_DN13951_c0_g1_i1:121-2319(+)
MWCGSAVAKSSVVAAGPTSRAWGQSSSLAVQQKRRASTACKIENDGEDGYVFVCNNDTQRDCMNLKVLGSPASELPDMERCIRPGTQLMLFNIESFSLIGTFVAIGAPGSSLVPDAFGGRFTAQVRVALLEAPVVQTTIGRRLTAGSRSASEWKALRVELHSKGSVAADGGVQDAWTARLGSAPLVSRENPAKRKFVKSEPVDWANDGRRHSSHDSSLWLADGKQKYARTKSWPSQPVVSMASLRSVAHGYVFLCTNATQQECLSSDLFGSPSWELVQMTRFIGKDTKVFLFNTESFKLVGTFGAVGVPQQSINPEAFGGKFSAHLSVQRRTDSLLETTLTNRIHNGPKTVEEVKALESQLQAADSSMANVALEVQRQSSTKEILPAPRVDSRLTASARGGETGYVFLCTYATQYECEVLELLGAPASELPQLQRCLTPSSRIFLFNTDCLKLMGEFVATAPPDEDIIPGAFGGHLKAHVRIALATQPLHEVKLDQWISAGPKSAAQVRALAAHLRRGGPVETSIAVAPPPAVDTQDSTEPLAKRQRGEGDTSWSASFIKAEICDDGHERFDATLECSQGEGQQYVASERYEDFEAVSTSGPRDRGYLFFCKNASEAECQRLRLFGSRDSELAAMKRHVVPGTTLFLLNLENLTLTGPLLAASVPGHQIVPGAFGGRFGAQVRVVAPPGESVTEVVLQTPVTKGPKLASAVKELKQCLDLGHDVSHKWAAAP